MGHLDVQIAEISGSATSATEAAQTALETAQEAVVAATAARDHAYRAIMQANTLHELSADLIRPADAPKPVAPVHPLTVMPRNTLNGWTEVATLSFTDGPKTAAELKAQHGDKLFGYNGYEPTRKGVNGLYDPMNLFDVPEGANYLRARPRMVNGKYVSGAIQTNGWLGLTGAMRHEMCIRVPKAFGTFKAVNMFWATDNQPDGSKTAGGNWKLLEIDCPEFDLDGPMGAYNHNVTSTPESKWGEPGFKAQQNVNPSYSSGAMKLLPTDWVVTAVEWTRSYVAWFVNGELMRLWLDPTGIPKATTMARQVFTIEPKLGGALNPTDAGELHVAWSRLFKKSA